MPNAGAEHAAVDRLLAVTLVGREDEDRQLVGAGRGERPGQRAPIDRHGVDRGPRAQRQEQERHSAGHDFGRMSRRRDRQPRRRAQPRLRPGSAASGRTRAGAASSRRTTSRPGPTRATLRSVRPRARRRSRSWPRGMRPSAASANVLPMVGCPAIGSSSAGVKMRMRAFPAARRRIDERRLREGHLGGDTLHQIRVECRRIGEHRELVPSSRVDVKTSRCR